MHTNDSTLFAELAQIASWDQFQLQLQPNSRPLPLFPISQQWPRSMLLLHHQYTNPYLFPLPSTHRRHIKLLLFLLTVKSGKPASLQHSVGPIFIPESHTHLHQPIARMKRRVGKRRKGHNLNRFVLRLRPLHLSIDYSISPNTC